MAIFNLCSDAFFGMFDVADFFGDCSVLLCAVAFLKKLAKDSLLFLQNNKSILENLDFFDELCNSLAALAW